MSKTIKQSGSFFDNKGEKDEFKKVKAKVCHHTIRLINHFKLDQALANHLTDCLVIRDTQFDDQFSFKFGSPVKGKRIPSSSITLKKIGSPFNFLLGGNRQANECSFVINFDNNQNINDIVFSFDYRINGSRFERGSIKMVYDAKFTLVALDLNESDYNIQTKKLTSMTVKKTEEMMMDEEAELFLLNMKFNKDHPLLKEALPEIAIDSAYDFNSDDFKSRLELVDMILV